MSGKGKSGNKGIKQGSEDGYDEKKIGHLKKRLGFGVLIGVALLYVSLGEAVNIPLPDFISPLHNPHRFALVQCVLSSLLVLVNAKVLVLGLKDVIRGNWRAKSVLALGSSIPFTYGVYVTYRIGVSGEIGNYSLVYYGVACTVLLAVMVSYYIEEVTLVSVKRYVEELVERRVLGSVNTGVLPNKEDREFRVTNDSSGDKVSSIYVAFVSGLAVTSSLYWLVIEKAGMGFSLSVFVSTMMIAFPCALLLAKPLPVKNGVTRGFSEGLVFKTSESVERLGNTKEVLLGLTGVLTTGEYDLVDVQAYNYQIEHSDAVDISEDENRLLYDESMFEMLGDVASIESAYDNPIGDAIVMEYRSRYNKKVIPPSFCERVNKKGLTGLVRNKRYYIGNKYYMDDLGVDTLDVDGQKAMLEGKTLLYIARGNKLVGTITVQDKIREEAKGVVDELNRLGYSPVLVTGANKRVADYVASKIGINRVRSGLTPIDMAKLVEENEIKGCTVLMVGYTSGDTYALSRASVGMALGAGDENVARSASVVSLEEGLVSVINGIRIGKEVNRNIKQNLVLAMVFNISCLPLAMGVWYTMYEVVLMPTVAVVALVISVCSVFLNAKRINRK